MCEFKVRSGGDVVAQEILTFTYSSDGQAAHFSDVLGRITEMPCGIVTGINMLPGHHDITMLQAPVAEKAVQLVLAIEKGHNNEADAGQVRQILQELTELIEIAL